jgi:hypothetical protein
VTYTVARDGQEDWVVTAVNDKLAVDHEATFSGRRARVRAERYVELMEESEG